MNRKKQRGQRRRLKAMFRNIDSFVPFSKTDLHCEHFHVPSGDFIDSDKTYGSVKTSFCRKWLETAKRFISEKPEEHGFCKIVAVLDVPNFWSSQIIIFYDESYYESFWDRTGPEQFWTFTQKKRSLSKERNIVTSLREMCYHEKIVEEDGEIFECDLWFYGDLPDINSDRQ